MNAYSAIDALRSQRVRAEGALHVRVAAGRTRIERLWQDGAAKIRMPDVSADPLEAVLINTAGGLTGGDRVSWRIEAGPGAGATVTTQACEKIYRAGSGHAELAATLVLGEGARLAWLPQETILFEGSALHRRLDVDLAPGAEALLVEAVVFGRRARGEFVERAHFSDQWRVRQAGALIHAEAFRIGPEVHATLERRGVGDGAGAMATLLLVGPKAGERLDAVRALIGEGGGASAWTLGRDRQSGKLLARLLASDSHALRQRLVPLIRLLNGAAGLPRVWSL